MTTTDAATLVDTYLEAYGEADAARRAELIAQVWSADGQLVDPPLDATGHDGIDAMAAAVQQQFPGLRFRRTTEVDEHHGFARYGWDLVGDDGSVAVAGQDVAQIDPSGKLVRVTGFFGDLAPLAG